MTLKLFRWRAVAGSVLVAGLAGAAVVTVFAQPPRGERGTNGVSPEASVNRLMAFDKNGDGKLSRDEIPDLRLAALLARADADNDGFVTREELTALFGKEAAASPRAQGGPGGPGPDGPGGPGDRGPGDRGPSDRGPGGPGGPGRGPGQIIPPFLQDELNLTQAQRRSLQELQQDVDAKLAKILTPEQLQQLQQPRGRGPGGPGNGPGGRGGPPPGGQPDGGGRQPRPQ